MKKILIHISPGFEIIRIKQLTEYCTRKSQFKKLLNISQVSDNNNTKSINNNNKNNNNSNNNNNDNNDNKSNNDNDNECNDSNINYNRIATIIITIKGFPISPVPEVLSSPVDDQQV